MEINITTLVIGLVGLLFGLLELYLLPILADKLGEVKYEKLVKWVKIGVNAAEMIFRESGMGVEKKAYVLNFLKSKGFKIDTAEVDAVIEAHVLELQKVVTE